MPLVGQMGQVNASTATGSYLGFVPELVTCSPMKRSPQLPVVLQPDWTNSRGCLGARCATACRRRISRSEQGACVPTKADPLAENGAVLLQDVGLLATFEIGGMELARIDEALRLLRLDQPVETTKINVFQALTRPKP